ncbi:universal stress protein [Seohaeicola sp. SP36]|uniref:universal stress protein n=1 Tax=unclassified Seohaeicola TaxID=2641111 RepID=UPI00237B3407|nr:MULTISPECIES: universal stress protein [unclassified Seohaeicola]MDD9707652.1 universal stress protein [Seohaeicola sp. 4SK31]MDD9735893.1 universal stress protein [Seohaeicola sp. SP36]
MFRNILMPIDIEHPESWEKALPMAVELTGTEGTLHILGIVHDIGSAWVAQSLPRDFEEKSLQNMKSRLNAFASEHLPGNMRVKTHVGHGHVAEHILKAAKTIGAELIVIAAHHPDDLRTLLIGSNSGKVVRNATIPVLTVR